MAKYSFGSGQLFTTPTGGGAPLQFGAVQDVSVDISSDIKMLYGQLQFPLATARGKSKIDVKFGSGEINVDAYNAFFFNQTVSAGQKRQARGEAASVPAATTYTITVANAANFDMNLGVIDATTGQAMKQVASAPTAGQYTVSTAGVYTFAAADANKPVLINYLWNDTASGRNMVISNSIMGDMPTFQVILTEKFKGKDLCLILYACVSDKLSLPFKQDDFMISDITASAQSNDAGLVGYLSHG